jgi:hypothetical protein
MVGCDETDEPTEIKQMDYEFEKAVAEAEA